MSYSRSTLREMERKSIRDFVENQKPHLTDRVLDYGCGEKPYRDLVSGEYVGWDLGMPPPDGMFDTILCTQVLEYLPNPPETIKFFYSILRPGGKLILTYPTLWEEVEPNDYWRFTKSGVELLTRLAGFKTLEHEKRCEIGFNDFSLAVGYGIVCEK